MLCRSVRIDNEEYRGEPIRQNQYGLHSLSFYRPKRANTSKYVMNINLNLAESVSVSHFFFEEVTEETLMLCMTSKCCHDKTIINDKMTSKLCPRSNADVSSASKVQQAARLLGCPWASGCRISLSTRHHPCNVNLGHKPNRCTFFKLIHKPLVTARHALRTHHDY